VNQIRIGNAPCSWGKLEFEGMKAEQIGYQQMLNELVETGYTGTELGDWGFMPTDPSILDLELRNRNLTMSGAFVPVALKYPDVHKEGESNALKVAHLLASVSKTDDEKPFLVLSDENGSDPVRTQNAGRISSEMAMNNEEWFAFSHGVERIAHAVLMETGLLTVFHHHCAGYVETPDEIGRLMDMTDPGLLGLVFDTGHYMYGSGTNDPQNVLKGLNRFGDRIWYMHFKDCQPEIASKARCEGWEYFKAIEHGVFCELGKGCVDFLSVVSWLQSKGYHGWICVEQDVLPGMGSPRESASRNRKYLSILDL